MSLAALVCGLATVLGGCGLRSVAGGTAGELRVGGEPLSDIRVGLYRDEETEPIGFAVTGNDGSFRLLQIDADGPLQLEPGVYRCTLESVGAPVTVPREFLSPEQTPLRVTWNEDDEPFTIEVPTKFAGM